MGSLAEMPRQLLRQELDSDAARRERIIAMYVAVICAAFTFPRAFLPLPAPWSSLPSAMPGAALLVYELVVLLLLRRGWYHRSLPWVSAQLEVLAAGAAVAVNAATEGMASALLGGVPYLIAISIVFSAIRARPVLCLVVAGAAAIEQAALFAFFYLEDGAPERLAILHFGFRTAGLLCAGLSGFAVSRYLVARAERALQVVREADLMGKYFLHERIGSGGMAEVFRATYSPEGGFKKTVALKRILPQFTQDASFNQLFREEARLCAMLSHPNVVQVTDCGQFHDAFILAMEFVDGIPLLQLVRPPAPALPWCVISYVGAELAAALEYIHERIGEDGRPLCLVHRDVNPANVLISRFGEVKLADFGVAHAARGRTLSADGFYGKVPYAAPEQLQGQPLDGRADLFALGLTLHEMSTGRRAVVGSDAQATQTLLTTTLPRLSTLRAGAPGQIDDLVAGLLARHPAERPASAASVRATLLSLEGELAPFPEGRKQLAQIVQRTISATAPAAAQDPEVEKATVPRPTVKTSNMRAPEGKAR